MASHDIKGREYARLSLLRAGDIIQVDDGFTCVEPWSRHVVRQRADGLLDFRCSEEGHTLEGQLDDDLDHLIGIYPG